MARTWIARAGVAQARAVGARLPSPVAGRAYDRGPRGPRARRGRRAVGSDRLPAARSRAAGGGLAALRGEILDGGADGVVRQRRIAALRGHDAVSALETADGVFLE